ncbi:M16 family metallopeptidase [Pseudovibrio sp. SPO723]|uniref:M16 family metallopeptidase n=1 Tax=Nesiotobacter zosterae TaxID=392721 RepID=UPI0029C38C92|nr:insulinase family protein [Pseudovibrio sp. SPO723]MDX5595712.1 insulinase family protein [Pseudovibrio sp. SPO723]
MCAFLTVIIGVSAAHSAPLQWDSRLTRATLANGFTYIIYPSGNDSDPFNLRLIVHAGSVDEAEPSGVAHILEHMAFQRTEAHPEGVHAYIDSLGWKTGLQVNALTRKTETQYMVRTRPNDALNLEQSINFLADITLGPKLLSEDWDNERKVILEELRLDGSLAERVNRQRNAVVLNGSRHVGRPPIGTRKSIEATTVEDLRAFHAAYYVPANMTLIVSGNVAVEQAVAAIESSFGAAPGGPAPDRSYVKLPLEPGLYIGKVQDPDGTTSRVAYGLRMALPPRNSEVGLKRYLENYFLKRLMRDEVWRARPHLPDDIKALTLTSKESTNERLVMAIAATTENHELGLEWVLRELERLNQNGISEEAFEALREKARDIASRNVAAAEARDFKQWEDRIASAVLQEGVLEDPSVRAERTLKWIDALTLEELNTRMREMLASTDAFLYYQVGGHLERELPSKDDVSALKRKFSEEALAPWPAPEPAAIQAAAKAPEKAPKLPELEPQEAQAAFGHKSFEETGVKEWTLANGDRVVWLNRPTPDGKLYVKALSVAGFKTEELPSWLSQAALQLWEQSGFSFWPQETYDQWAQTVPARWSWKQRDTELDIAAVMAPDKLSDFLKTYHHRVVNGLVREEGLTALRTSVAEERARQARQRNRLSDKVAALRFGAGDDSLPSEADLAALTVDELERAARRLLAEPVTLFLVGEADAAQLEALTTRYLGTLPRTLSLTPAPSLQMDGTHETTFKVYDSDRASVTLHGFTPMDWGPEAGFKLSTLTPIAQLALKRELRHRLSGIYSLEFELSLDKDQNRAVSRLHFVCASERAQELAEAAKATLSRLHETVADANVRRIREDIGFAEEGRLRDANTWLRRLALSYARYGDPRYLESMRGLADEMTTESLEALAKQVFPQPHSVLVIGLPKE